MKKFVALITASAVLLVETTHAKSYNILSIDGGGIRGILPGIVISNMEKYAYEYGVKNKSYNIPLHENYKTGKTMEAVHMSYLFDMMAGTSTGSIIAAGLSYPKVPGEKTPKYFAGDMVEIYTQKG